MLIKVDVHPADLCDGLPDRTIGIFIQELLPYTSNEFDFSETLIKQLCTNLSEYITSNRKKKLLKQVMKALELEGYEIRKK